MFCTSGPNLTSCAHKWGQYTPTLITMHLVQQYPIRISILKSCATQVGILQQKTRQIWGIWKLRPAYSPETPNIGDVLYRVTLKFDGWPWKTIGHLSLAVSSFVQHFIAIGEFKLELLSGNAKFGSNSTIFRAVWPRNSTYDLEKQKGTSTMLLQALCIIW